MVTTSRVLQGPGCRHGAVNVQHPPAAEVLLTVGFLQTRKLSPTEVRCLLERQALEAGVPGPDYAGFGAESSLLCVSPSSVNGAQVPDTPPGARLWHWGRDLVCGPLTHLSTLIPSCRAPGTGLGSGPRSQEVDGLRPPLRETFPGSPHLSRRCCSSSHYRQVPCWARPCVRGSLSCLSGPAGRVCLRLALESVSLLRWTTSFLGGEMACLVPLLVY